MENEVLDLFEKTHKQTKRNIHTPILEVLEQATVKYLFTGRANGLHEDKTYTFVES